MPPMVPDASGGLERLFETGRPGLRRLDLEIQVPAPALLIEEEKLLLPREGNHKIDRTETGFAGGVAFKTHSPRPATAEEEDTEVVSAATTN